jgi:hypothetical protein
MCFPAAGVFGCTTVQPDFKPLNQTKRGDVVLRLVDAKRHAYAVGRVANDGDVSGADEVIVTGRVAVIAKALVLSPRRAVWRVDGPNEWHKELPSFSN